MQLKPSSILRCGVLAAVLVLASSPAWANFIVYNEYMAYQAIRIDGVDYTCETVSDPKCAFIAIIGESDTSTVTPFSVTGASGFRNSLTAAHISVSFNDGSTPYSADIDLTVGGLYVSVDQTNNGAGFSSSYGPTYPLATYGAAAFGSYDLAHAFFASGVGPFCPTSGLPPCADGGVLQDVGGIEFVITVGRAPAYSSFSSTVAESPTIPEPGTTLLIAVALAGLGFSRRRKLH
jgi:PEP-CTERM motif